MYEKSPEINTRIECEKSLEINTRIEFSKVKIPENCKYKIDSTDSKQYRM